MEEGLLVRTLKNPRTLLAIAVLVAALAAGFSASRGINEDQMISYQAGLRHVQGQRIYEDFSVPHGPLAGLLFAPFLLITPTGGTALIAASIALNIAAVLLIWFIVSRATRDALLAFLASLITAMWYVPIFGTYYHDHLAYLLVLAAFAVHMAYPGRTKGLVLCAVLLALSFHAKQTVGVMGAVSFGVTYLLVRRTRESLARMVTLAGIYLLAQAAILLLIAALSDFPSYITHTYLIPSEFMAESGRLFKPLGALFFPYHAMPWNAFLDVRAGVGLIVFYPLVLCVYAAYYALARAACSASKGMRRQAERAFEPLLFLTLSTLWVSAMLGRSFTEVALSIGGITAITAHLLLSGVTGAKAKPRVTRAGAVCATLLVATLALPFIAINSMDIGKDLTHTQGKDYPVGDLAPVRVFSSERFGTVEKEDIFAATEYLKGKDGGIAVIDDEIFLVPLVLRTAPTSPEVEYHMPLTVPNASAQASEEWQREFIEHIERASTRYLVSSIGDGERELRIEGLHAFDRLNLLEAYIAGNYTLVFESGKVKVYERILGGPR